MLKFLFYLFLAYLLYKLVFGFIIPVYRTTRKVKRSFREMNERMRQHETAAGGFGPQPTSVKSPAQKSSPGDKGDYIDFEEVKE